MKSTYLIHNGDMIEPYEWTGTREDLDTWLWLLRKEGYYGAYATPVPVPA